MCGIFRFSSRGEIFSTSPSIQSKPSVVTCSLPRVAINCMPTQMPKNGRALLAHRFRHRFQHAIERIEPPAAIGEGADAGQHDAIGAKHRLGIARHHDLLRIFHAPRGALERLRRGVQIAGTVIDDRNAHRDPPGSGNNPMMPPCGSGGGFENGWPGISRVGGGAPRSTGPSDRWSARAASRSSGRRSAARRSPRRRPPRYRAGAICAATASSAAGSPLRTPSGSQSERRRRESHHGRRRAPPIRTGSQPSKRSSRSAPATADARQARSAVSAAAQK